jgi:type IV pilus assembly protein PilW
MISGSNQAGFSLVELMVAVTLGMLIMLVLSAAMVSSSQARRETDQASRQVENGRYAMQILSDDLALAGYYSEFDPWPLPTPAAKPDPCATSVASLKTAMPLHVQGYDNPTATTIASLTCLSDVRPGVDIVVIRRTSSCVAGSTGCDVFVGGTTQPYFQASLCASATELDSALTSDYYAMDTAAAGLIKHKRDCTTLADFHRFVTRIYFVANNDNPGDGIPTLKRAELGATGFSIVPLVEGIENLQLEYGLDNGATTDGAPHVFTADPDGYTGAGAAGATGNWRNVVALRVNLLARNTEITPGYNDGKVYTLGHNADASANTCSPGSSALPALCSGVAYKRHAFTAQVRMTNPAERGVTP